MNEVDASHTRTKPEYVMKIGMRLEAGQLNTAEASEKLGISHEELNEMLRGEYCDLTATKISQHLNRLWNSNAG